MTDKNKASIVQIWRAVLMSSFLIALVVGGDYFGIPRRGELYRSALTFKELYDHIPFYIFLWFAMFVGFLYFRNGKSTDNYVICPKCDVTYQDVNLKECPTCSGPVENLSGYYERRDNTNN